jgi:hypothetical protein
MNRFSNLPRGALLAVTLAFGPQALAAASADEAAKLKGELTPLGAEKAGNKDGTIPVWDGGYTKPVPADASGKRGDPFKDEKPLFSITAKNMDQYADKLTDGTKALMAKYADSFRIDVFPTHRTAAAPQWVYDNTFKNATRAKLVDDAAGPRPDGAYGGVPFPIPKSGIEVMWNHVLRWRGDSYRWSFHGYQVTADGKLVMTNESHNDTQMPYYFKDGAPESFKGEYWMVRSINSGPAIRAGEAITGRLNVNEDKTQTWVYLTGQRRVRKLPTSCCDTPTPFSAGLTFFDEVEVLATRMDRFDWKLVGKKELFIPYNSNKTHLPAKDADVLGPRHLNPDHVRWELHRVWVVEATLKDGKRHVVPKSRYYVDEDSWLAVLGDRWDAQGQLWRVVFNIPMVLPDIPAVGDMTWGMYDLVAGTQFVNVLPNEFKANHYKLMPRFSDTVFTPDAMAGEGVR